MNVAHPAIHREQVWRSKRYPSHEVITLAVTDGKVVYASYGLAMFSNAAVDIQTESAFRTNYEFKD